MPLYPTIRYLPVRSCPHFLIMRTHSGTYCSVYHITYRLPPSPQVPNSSIVDLTLSRILCKFLLIESRSPLTAFPPQFRAVSHADSHTNDANPPSSPPAWPSPLPPVLPLYFRHACSFCCLISLFFCYIYTVMCHLLCHCFQISLCKYILSFQIDSKLFQGRKHTLPFPVSLTQRRIPLNMNIQ